MRSWIVLCLGMGLWLALATSSFAASRVALVIGNADYAAFGRLKNPLADATAVAATLEKLGFVVLSRQNLDAQGFRAALAELAEKSSGAEVSLVYYAGHGFEMDGTNYLVPTDAKLEKKVAARLEAISLDDVREVVSSAGKLRVVILDACRNNPFPLLGRDGKRAVSRGLTRVEPNANELIAYSAREGTTAADGEGDNSPFALALVKRLAEPGVEVGFLFRKVRGDVVAATSGAQEPFVYATLGEEELYLNPQNLDPPAEVAKAGPAPAPATDPAAAAWAIAEKSGDRGMLEAMRDRFPATVYADFAKAKLALLNLPVKPVPAACADLVVSVGFGGSAKQECLKTGDVFRDLDDGPEMVVVPAGKFTMGSTTSDDEHQADESPQHKVDIRNAFAVGKFEVTRGQFDAFYKATAYGVGEGCYLYAGKSWTDTRGKSWRDPGYKQTDEHPVVCISWDDAKAYVSWLSKQTGHEYRLLSEAEWEYSARAGSTGRYSWGYRASHEQANYGKDQCCVPLAKGKDNWDYTAPAGSFAANDFGLFDMHGNVWEWLDDCYVDSYKNGPTTDEARAAASCDYVALRGGSWGDDPHLLRVAGRYHLHPNVRGNGVGFRLARALTP